jgi:hypothetical protein
MKKKKPKPPAAKLIADTLARDIARLDKTIAHVANQLNGRIDKNLQDMCDELARLDKSILRTRRLDHLTLRRRVAVLETMIDAMLKQRPIEIEIPLK